ncbi:MAG TPA: Uma2 family endonuclease [Gemmataceae bacterium]|jgi:Uma2 family endonuclease
MDTTEPWPFRWGREDYYRLCHEEWFLERRVQLIGGEIVEFGPSHNWHDAALTLTQDQLRAAFGTGYWVRIRGSLDVSDCSVPDPDLAVIAGSPRQYRKHGNPETALLVVEVSEATLWFDRDRKSSLYASANVADYWIVNLVQRQLEVYRDPVADSTQLFGFRYNSRTILDPPDTVSPLAVSQASITVADLLR